MPFEVQSKQCSTCIYRKDSVLDLNKLEAEIADPFMKGFFRSYRQCHHSDSACCRGFWNHHKDHFAIGQVAQRMKGVVFVDLIIRNDLTWLEWARLKLVWVLFPCRYGWGACSNRNWRIIRVKHIKLTFVMQDLKKPTTYSREELYCMLLAIRKAEATYTDGWKVPEPDDLNLEGVSFPPGAVWK